MIAGLQGRLDGLLCRHEELEARLADPDVVTDMGRYRRLSREHARLSETVRLFREWKQAGADRQTAMELRADPELAELAASEYEAACRRIDNLERALQLNLLPRDEEDDGAAYLEIRAGTGGDESALFAGDLWRMYQRYADARGWQSEVLSHSDGEVGGFREIICRVDGEGVYGRLKFESGVHRVQRVPETEAQGRIHTSACTVAVLPEPGEVSAVVLDPAELRIDTYRAAGAGGQHVNKTESAVRITHLPSGMVVECQDDRSQHKNRARAMAVLTARLNDRARQQAASERAETRRGLVGGGDRSERIRTYNFPQGRLTDHRINLTLYRLPAILAGDLDEVLDALAASHQAAQLAALAEDQG